MNYNLSAQHSTAQHSTAQHSTAQHSTAQHSTAQHSTAQHSTAQHSTAQHSTVDLRALFYYTIQIMSVKYRAFLPFSKAMDKKLGGN
ncbi:adenine methyltransferase [Lactococcus sp. LG592]|uniref:adenine methyltransferase n=1 Tax=Lactococcus sp. LG592 TaxID=2816911 RepID=UPI001F5D5773|nr:adenine methyltransferase [Lactococcus sp. LG592]